MNAILRLHGDKQHTVAVTEAIRLRILSFYARLFSLMFTKRLSDDRQLWCHRVTI